jgi:hypothetical protein
MELLFGHLFGEAEEDIGTLQNMGPKGQVSKGVSFEYPFNAERLTKTSRSESFKIKIPSKSSAASVARRDLIRR